MDIIKYALTLILTAVSHLVPGTYTPPLPPTTTTQTTQTTVAKSSTTPQKEPVKPSALKTVHFAEYTSPAGTTSQYHLFADNIDWNKPVKVVVRLHGDGDYTSVREFDRYKNGLVSQLANDASMKNAIVLAPKSPDRKGNITWWENMTYNEEWLTSLINNHILTNSSIDKSQVYWNGYSGGSEFLSYYYIAKNPDLMTGGVLFCAGGGSSKRQEAFLASSTVQRNIPLSWRVGALDDGSTSIDGFDALEASLSGYEAYKRQGFTRAERVVVPGKDHYNIDQRAMMNDTIIKWMK